MNLTKLEVKTLKKLASGKVIKQIAWEDDTTHSAIDKRIKNIKRKLNAKTLAQCIYKVTKAGIICLLIAASTSFEIRVAMDDDYSDIEFNRVPSRIKTGRKL
ncbi:signal transduction response regulator,C-terminal effector [Vibrio phage 242E40-1]|nr:signal transduction response regulator,C-terminal effector [Vibrio phage 242E40-1]